MRDRARTSGRDRHGDVHLLLAVAAAATVTTIGAPSAAARVDLAPRPIEAARAFALPSAKRCIPGRSLTVRVRDLPSVTWIRATVSVNGKRRMTIPRRRIGRPVKLRNLPAGKFRLSIKAQANGPRAAVVTRRYRRCGAAKHVASQVTALADSAMARRAVRDLASAVHAPAVAKFSTSVLGQPGAQLPASDRALLELTERLAHPRERALISKLRAGRALTPAQRKLLRRLRAAFLANPTVRQATAKGRSLKRRPAELASILKALVGTPVALGSAQKSTGDPLFDSARSTLSEALTAAPAKALSARMRKILSGPGAVEYVQTLPPLVVASLAEAAEPRAAAASTTRGRLAAQPVCQPGSDRELIKLNAWLVVINAVFGYDHSKFKEEVIDLSERALTGADIEGPLSRVYKLITSYSKGEDLAKDIYRAYLMDHPPFLALCPDSASITAGESQRFAVQGLDDDRKSLVPMTDASLSILPDGTCSGYSCGSTTPGPHTVIARHGDAMTTSKLMVITGPRAHLDAFPSDSTVGAGGTQVYSITAKDKWFNRIGPVEFGDAPGEAKLSITDGVCFGSTCIPKKLGDHTVTATDGTFTATAQLTVVAGPLHDLVLTPDASSIIAGGSQSYTVKGRDVFGDDLGPVTGATLEIKPDGSCEKYSCTASVPGPHTVTATATEADVTAHGTASLEVTGEPTIQQIAGSPFATGSGPAMVSFSPDGGLLATVNQNGPAVSMFSIGSGGALTQVTGSPFTSDLAHPSSLAFSPGGDLLALGTGFTNAGDVFSVGAGGALTHLRTVITGSWAANVAFSPNGHLLVFAGNGWMSVFSISRTEQGTTLSLVTHFPFATADGRVRIAFSPDGRFIAAASTGAVTVFSVSESPDPMLTQVAGSPFTTGKEASSVAFSPDSKHLAITTINRASQLAPGTVSVFSVSSEGALTEITGSPFTTGPRPVSVAFSAGGALLATANETTNVPDGTVSVFSVGAGGALNPVTGSPFSTGNDVRPLSVAFSPAGGLLATANVGSSGAYGSVSVFSLGSHY